MNLLQLVLKQMRQRALSSWLTAISVTLGVALAVAILVVQRESHSVLAQTDFGYSVLVGPKGSDLQLVLNSVYHIDRSPGNIPYSVYEQLLEGGEFADHVRLAVPIAVGDNYEGFRIVGTLPKMFGFDDEGQPLEGYDELGRLRDGYQSARTPPNQRDPDRPIAAPALELRSGQKLELAAGRMFHAQKFEAVIGPKVAEATGLTVGSTFKAVHDVATTAMSDVHDELWTVVGILEPTGTANDRLLFIPLTSFYAISGHAESLEAIAAVRGEASATRPAEHDDHGDHEENAEHADGDGHDDHEEHDAHEADAHDDHRHGAYSLDDQGIIHLHLPKSHWLVSAVYVDTYSSHSARQLVYIFRNRDEALAVEPAMVMREFFDNFLNTGSMVLLVISVLVTIVAAVSILVSIYNSVSARIREIAILRALGATRGRILAIISLEATLLGAIGAVAGLIVGHLVAAGGSAYLRRLVGEGFAWHAVAWGELAFLIAVVIISFLAGLVPALKAYQAPVADNLVNQ